MTTRSALGSADVTDQELTRMVAASFNVATDAVQLLTSSAVPVDYQVPAITTAARHWVRGTARVGSEEQSFAFFVKTVQSFARSPIFAELPQEFQAQAEASMPWRTEPLVYQSDLRGHLPDGFTMPYGFSVRELDSTSAAIWMESVPVAEQTWDLDLYEHAAHLLGRFAASPAVARFADIGAFDWTVLDYVHGRLAHQVVPALHSEDVWSHPVIAAAFTPELRERLRAAGSAITSFGEELAGFPAATSHGDACPNNLLLRPGTKRAFTLIDFNFLHRQPVGFDLGQLVVGDVQIGRRSSDDLRERDEGCLRAYHQGLLAEGVDLDLSVVRRAHALQLLLFAGLSSVPLELLEQPPTSENLQIAADRAAIAEFSLDLVDVTG